MKLNQTERAIVYVVVILCFQITRNISSTLYVGILFIAYAWMFASYLHRVKFRTTKVVMRPRLLEWLFVLTMLCVPIVSLAHMQLPDYFVALPRYAVTLPFLLFCFIYRDYRDVLVRRVLQVLCIFVALASMSIPFQIIFGRIWFLADPGVRDGLERYASLAGSLTELGSLGVYSTCFVAFSGEFLFKRKIKVVLLVATVLGMLLSLQKASIINLIICLVLYVLFGSDVKFGVLKRLGLIGVICVFGYALYNQLSQTAFGTYVGGLVQYSFSNSSLGTKADLLSRLWQRPDEVIVYNGIHLVGFITGIGFPALSGTMGLPNMPMAHNNYFDDLLSGGVLQLVSYVLLLLRVPYKIIRSKVYRVRLHSVERCYALLHVFILINMFIGAATFYQPLFSVVIYFTIFSYGRIRWGGESGNAVMLTTNGASVRAC